MARSVSLATFVAWKFYRSQHYNLLILAHRQGSSSYRFIKDLSNAIIEFRQTVVLDEYDDWPKINLMALSKHLEYYLENQDDITENLIFYAVVTKDAYQQFMKFTQTRVNNGYVISHLSNDTHCEYFIKHIRKIELALDSKTYEELSELVESVLAEYHYLLPDRLMKEMIKIHEQLFDYHAVGEFKNNDVVFPVMRNCIWIYNMLPKLF